MTEAKAVDENIVEWFDRTAERMPQAPALICQGRQVTFSRLQRQSNAWANHLLAEGVEAGEVVGVFTQDRMLAIPAMLAVLKAGGAFVALDTSLPARRLQALLEHVPLRWLLSDRAQAKALESLGEAINGARCICLDGGKPGDEFASVLPGERSGDGRKPGLKLDPDGLAYVFFTSGSTGKPKGIAGRLKGIDHFLRWEKEALRLDAGVRVSQLLPLTFDGSLRDVFLPLCVGGTICLPQDREVVLDAKRLLEWLDTEGVEVVHCVPSLFRSLVNESREGRRLSRLRCILMAGEPLLTADVQRWMGVYGEQVQLVNLYGTSETTMAKFAHFVTAADIGKRSIPIGKPIPGAQAFLLDQNGNLAPPGTVGEIYIQTPYCSLGYFGQPEITREVFVPNPLSQDPDDIVYRTGDLGHQSKDGIYEYLGRLDQQVKVRGVRVELGDVEEALRQHADVKDVAVVDRQDAQGFTYLCAYVVLPVGQSQPDLRQHALEMLPDALVPSAFVVLTELPRTISGKVDRKALPAPQFSEDDSQYLVPRTPLERSVAEIWKEVLRIEKIGMNTNFFQMGGHSLTAARILSRLRQVFGLSLAVQELLENSTIAKLSSLIEAKLIHATEEAAAERANSPEELPLRPVAQAASAPLSYSQQRMWLSVQINPESPAFNVFMPLRWSGPLSHSAAQQAFNEIIRRHTILRSCFEMSGDRPVQRVQPYSPGGMVPVVDLSGLPAEKRDAEVMSLVSREGAVLFDLRKDLPIRVTHLILAKNEHVVLIVIHHIATDAESAAIFEKEFSLFYQAICENRPAEPPELPIQYSDFSHCQREWLAGNRLSYQQEYWKEQLEGAPRVPGLRTDRPRSSAMSLKGGYHHFVIGADSIQKITELAAGEGATLFMIVLAAFETLLYRITGEADWVIGTDIANRTQAATEPLIGFFVNVLALRTRIAPGMTFRRLLQKVRRTAMDAYAHQDLPFEEVLKAVGRDHARAPLFQVFFVIEHEAGTFMNIPGVRLAKLRFDNNVALRELSLYGALIRNELHLAWNFRSDLFEAATIQCWTRNLLAILQHVVAQPDSRLEDIDLLETEAASLGAKAPAQAAEKKFKTVKPKAVDLVSHL